MSTFGCIGCSQTPYAVIQPYSVESQGVIEYISNCTFDKKYLSCNTESYILHFEQNHDSCLMEVPSINVTLHIDLKYKFYGDINQIEYEVSSETIGGVFKSIVTSDSFIVVSKKLQPNVGFLHSILKM